MQTKNQETAMWSALGVSAASFGMLAPLAVPIAYGAAAMEDQKDAADAEADAISKQAEMEETQRLAEKGRLQGQMMVAATAGGIDPGSGTVQRMLERTDDVFDVKGAAADYQKRSRIKQTHFRKAQAEQEYVSGMLSLARSTAMIGIGLA